MTLGSPIDYVCYRENDLYLATACERSVKMSDE